MNSDNKNDDILVRQMELFLRHSGDLGSLQDLLAASVSWPASMETDLRASHIEKQIKDVVANFLSSRMQADEVLEAVSHIRVSRSTKGETQIRFPNEVLVWLTPRSKIFCR